MCLIKAAGRFRRALTRGLVVAGLAVLVPMGSAQAQVPPDESWQTLTTEHFRVTYPERLQMLGRKAAERAEVAYAELSSAFADPPGGTLDLLITDHTDESNGYAQVTPSNRITIYARPPVDDPSLGYFDDWMELVITHELAHIFHLDQAGTLGSILRGVFGRVPNQWPFFTGLAAPRWTIEGLATWYESDLTRAGRVSGTFHEMVMRTATLEGRFERLDQASGESPMWPSGNRSYTYGSMFFDYLLEKHGRETLVAFAEAVAGQWVPYRLDAAGRDAFGASISEEWSNWSAELADRYADFETELARTAPVTRAASLTPRSRVALYPRVSPDGGTLAYAAADGRSDAQIRVSALDGTGQRQFTRTSSLPTLDWLPGGSILFSHLEFTDPYRTYGDLIVQAPDGGQRRLTHGARLGQPSAGPDGTWAAAIREGGGTSALVRVDLASGEVTELVPPRPDVHWAHPAVSPDGAWIAAARWTPGSYTDVIILDASGTEVMQLTNDRALDLAPTWSPDGGTVLWSSDRTGILNIVAADVNPQTRSVGAVRMVTNTATGVAYPEVSPDGAWLFMSTYHVDGWEVERVPYVPSAWPLAPAISARFEAPAAVATASGADAEAAPGLSDPHGYSALPTLLPRYWEPLFREPVNTSAVQTDELFLRSRQVLGAAVGAQTSGRDLVGRHAYSAFARFFTESDGQMDAGMSYTYAGLGTPVLGLSADQRWGDDGVRVAQAHDEAPLDTLFVLQRDRSVFASSTFHRRTWRSSLALSVAGGMSWERRELLDNDLLPATAYRLNQADTRLSDFRATLSYSTARSHSLQMGPSEGLSLWIRGRVRRDLTVADSLSGRPGRDRSVDEVLAVARGYLNLGGPGHAAHVVAVRLAGGYADGPNAHAGFLDVGGASGRSEDITGMDLFGGSSIFLPVRGYRASYRSGRMAWTATAEYRAPLAMLNRGLGAWPLHVDRMVGALFVDAGNAWGPELEIQGYHSPRRAALISVGAELTTEVLTFWNIMSRVRVGVAQPLVEGDGTAVYLRLGLPF